MLNFSIFLNDMLGIMMENTHRLALENIITIIER